MRPVALLPPLLLLLAIAVKANSSEPFAVVSYLPEWRFEGCNWDIVTKHSTHLILFSLEMAPSGDVIALDRLPRPELLQEALAARTKNGAKLLICFGGNGRSNGFSGMVSRGESRARFLQQLLALCEQHGFDGVDYNWEYPGYAFGQGYLSEERVRADYEGLQALLRETRAVFGAQRIITLAYYPDTRQEALLKQYDYGASVDLMHSMAYDQGGSHHSSLAFAERVLAQAKTAGLPMSQVTLGLPFYGRSTASGDWQSYEDIVQQHWPLDPAVDSVLHQAQHAMVFNGVALIKTKTLKAISAGFGGVMVWEVGQDCRLAPVTQGDKTHPVTCPGGEATSLLVGGIAAAIAEQKTSVISTCEPS